MLKKYLIFSETHLIDRLDPDRSGQFFDHSYFNRQGVADKPFNDFFRNNDGDLIFFSILASAQELNRNKQRTNGRTVWPIFFMVKSFPRASSISAAV